MPGLIWFALAGVMVLSLASAAQGSMPQPWPVAADPPANFHPSPEIAFDDTADQRPLLATPAPVNPAAPAPESHPENAGR